MKCNCGKPKTRPRPKMNLALVYGPYRKETIYA